MARQQVDTRMGVEQLRPQAAAVDTYVTPARSPLADFADALGRLDGPLREFMDNRAKKQEEDDRIRGQAAFYGENSSKIADAVRSGAIPAHYSPSFLKGFKNAQGEVTGGQIQAQFSQAFDQWGGKNNGSLEDYQTFVKGFIQTKIGEGMDKEVLRTLVPQISQMYQGGLNKFDAYRHEQTYKGSLDAHAAGAMQAVDQLNEAGLSSEKGTDYKAAFGSVLAKRDQFVASGGKPDDFDKTVVDAMSLKVLQLRDPQMLDFFKQKVPGTNHTYGDTPYGAKVKADTESALTALVARADAEDTRKRKAAEEAAKDETQRQAIDILSADPSATISPELLASGSKYDPKFKVNIEEWRNSLNRGFTDEKALMGLYEDITSGGGTTAVKRALTAGVFGKSEDLTKAMAFAKSLETNKEKLSDIGKMTVYKDIESALDIRTKGKNDIGDPISGMSNEGFEANYDFRRKVQAWVIANPDAKEQEIEEAITAIGKTTLDRIKTPEDDYSSGTYDRAKEDFANPYSDATKAPPVDASFPNLYSSDNPPSPEERAAAQKTMQDAGDDDEDLNDDVTFVRSGMTAEQSAALERLAKSRGVDVDTFIKAGINGKGNLNKPDPTTTQSTSRRFEPVTTAEITDRSSRDGANWNLGSMKANALVIHHTGGRGTVDGVVNVFKQRGYPAHFIIDREGKVHQILGTDQRGQHTKNSQTNDVTNANSWGVEIIAKDDNDVTPQQAQTAARLAQHLHETKGMPLDRVFGHGEINSHKQRTEGAKVLALLRQGNGMKPLGPSGTNQPVSLTRDTVNAWLDEALGSAGSVTGQAGKPSASNPGSKITDPVANKLVGLILEGEASGNWNAVYGNSRSQKDLGSMSLNQVLATQASQRRRGAASTAVGGGQFIYKTLNGLKSSMGLSGNEPFNRDLQERMIMKLLQQRGYDKWRSGKMSNRQFALGISQEWASIANPLTGKSYYDGDGLNKSKIAASRVYDALGM